MITETYRDIEITLLEEENKWRFTANGRERSAPTLPKAREYIDNALDEITTKKVKPWQPFDAYLCRYSDSKFRLVTVTSRAERNRYSSRVDFWITENGSRSKVDGDYLYAKTPKNDKLIADYHQLVKELEALEEKVSEAKGRIQHITIPKDAEAA
jgi:predicted mannosyl-3-phosphoglycerate phosphatase (HAD superfamily)